MGYTPAKLTRLSIRALTGRGISGLDAKDVLKSRDSTGGYAVIDRHDALLAVT
jgi:hypothetical protein